MSMMQMMLLAKSSAVVADSAFVFKVSIGAGGSFQIPHYPGKSYNYDVDWGDGNTDTGVTSSSPHTYTNTSTTTFEIRITGTFPAIFFDNTGDKLKVVSVDNIGDVGWETFDEAFFGCSNMTSFTAGSGANTSNVQDMSQMLQNCTSLTSANFSGFDTGSATTMTNMFRNCNSLTTLDLSDFDTSSVTTMREMFFDCIDLTTLDVSSFNTLNCTNFFQMFRDCRSLTSIDVSSFSAGTSNTSSVTTMGSMFRECSSLTDISGVEDFSITGLSGTSALTNFMTSPGKMTTAQYDALLVEWESDAGSISAQSPNFGGSQYTANSTAATARTTLTTTHGWTITDGGSV